MSAWFSKLSCLNLTSKVSRPTQRAGSSETSSDTSPKAVSTSTVKPKTTDKDSYSLSRTYQGSSRLNLQYFLWNHTLGFDLHPSVHIPSGTSCIADVATGTGIWLVALSEQISEHQYVGFDISLAQAPDKTRLPDNIRMVRWDIFQPPPMDFVGSFDVVHIRHMHLVIKNDNVMPVVENLRALLKPNGYLQWDEVDPEANYIARTDAATSTPALDHLFNKFKIPKGEGGTANWKHQLPAIMNAHGFADSKLHSYEPSPSSYRFWHDLYMQSWEEFIKRAMGGLDAAEDLIAAAGAEARSGAVIVYPMRVWVARAV
ncbi:MAG: hypothetical protein M1836_003650 [Candelina mexicana]|nr:MAG: hypothetical protein M1836_003650 [Candelina mexicana]